MLVLMLSPLTLLLIPRLMPMQAAMLMLLQTAAAAAAAVDAITPPHPFRRPQMMREDGVPPNEVPLRAVLLALENALPPPDPPAASSFKPRRPCREYLRPPFPKYTTYMINLIDYAFPSTAASCQIVSPSKTGFILSAHRLIHINLLILVQATL